MCSVRSPEKNERKSFKRVEQLDVPRDECCVIVLATMPGTDAAKSTS